MGSLGPDLALRVNSHAVVETRVAGSDRDTCLSNLLGNAEVTSHHVLDDAKDAGAQCEKATTATLAWYALSHCNLGEFRHTLGLFFVFRPREAKNPI